MERRASPGPGPALLIVMGVILFSLGGVRFASRGDWLGAVLYCAIGVGWWGLATIAHRKGKETEDK